MKKRSILFLAGGLLALASCNSNTGNGGMTPAQVDSAVNVKVQELTVKMQATNDSMINMMAKVKADSMIAAMKGATTSSAPATHNTRHTAPAPAPVAAPPPPNTNTGKINQPAQNGGQSQQGTNTGKRR